ncbi:hypothetical protein [Pedobacter cryophilus]|uniref:Co-chaperone DjlA N-terminal domain-containing protein n=1 Tax=Pedobacter cryophilus TaxID=2571271 RepID=A0A4U1C281_9SPHI|nr:hypothetical protein [Pedobacter cryophilus]TKB99134.1 hypothetical protein FA046_08480 [Pedobacter cryophilus]
MQARSETHKRLYQSIGKLCYAIAAIDRSVKEQEIDALKQIVRKEWLSVDDFEDEFGTDAAYQMEVVFDWLLEHSPSATNCFKDFEDFKMEHQQLFKPKLSQLIMKTAESIAAAFANKNKSELVLLSELQLLLDKKHPN